MTLQELKDFLGTLSEEQLKQPAIFFPGDDTDGLEIDHWDISEEDMYWERHGDCLGNLEQAKDTFGDEWEEVKEDHVTVPKGTITFHSLVN